MHISGTWYNELKSTMVLDAVLDGGFTGSYTTAVSSDGCAKGSYRLVGRTDGQAVAFVVCWVNDESNCEAVSAWSGQAQTIDGEEKIIALWLMTSETSPDKDWTSTRVGQDVFTKKKPVINLKTVAKVSMVSNP